MLRPVVIVHRSGRAVGLLHVSPLGGLLEQGTYQPPLRHPNRSHWPLSLARQPENDCSGPAMTDFGSDIFDGKTGCDCDSASWVARRHLSACRLEMWVGLLR